jgi:hypothetical protein
MRTLAQQRAEFALKEFFNAWDVLPIKKNLHLLWLARPP